MLKFPPANTRVIEFREKCWHGRIIDKGVVNKVVNNYETHLILNKYIIILFAFHFDIFLIISAVSIQKVDTFIRKWQNTNNDNNIRFISYYLWPLR